jgi:hypothetical protein
MPLRLQTAAAPSQIWITGELDAAMARRTEWQQGARVRVYFQHELGNAPQTVADLALDAGQRTFQVTPPPGFQPTAGRYVVRVELTPKNGSNPLQTVADVIVPETGWLVSATGLVARRGPSTGLHYALTADSRFRRTERIRLEVPRSEADGTASARLLGRRGQPLSVAVVLSERIDDTSKQRMVVADLPLAPLAPGEYALEVAVEQGDRKESASYAFRIIP